MAFSKSLPKGQIPVGCQLCEGGQKIEWKCTDCSLLMCDRCKVGVHLRIAKDHGIVNIREIGEVEDSWDSFVFSELKCKDHHNQPCSLYCRTCNKVICLKCIVKSHNGHTFVDEEEFIAKKEVLKEGQKKFEKYLSKLNSAKEKMNGPEDTDCPKVKSIKQNILGQKKKLYEEVDKYAGCLIQDIDQHLRTLKQEEETKIDTEITNIHVKNDALGSIVTSRDFMKFFREFDTLNVSFKEDMYQGTMSINYLPNFEPGEMQVLNFGKLEGIRRLKEPKHKLKVTNQFTTELNSIHFIVQCHNGTLWIADSAYRILQNIKLHEKQNARVLSSFNIEIYGLVEISSNNILVSTGEARLKLIYGRTKLITKSVFNVAPFASRDVHITKDQKVIITARSPGPAFPVSGKRIVMVFNQAGNRLLKYEFDSNSKPLFSIPLSVTSTSNGNICVIDRLYEDGRGRVVMISQEGKTIGIYTGHRDVNTKVKPFKPDDILVTPLDYIVLTDPENHLVHILNSDGDFISYHCVHDIGIGYPYSIALSASGHLFIGCGNHIREDRIENFRAKLYDIEYSGIY